MQLRIDPNFLKAHSRLSSNDIRAVDHALEKFIENPRYPDFHMERLQGSSFFSIRATRHIRILLRQEESDLFAAVNVGSRQVYRKISRKS